MKMIEGSLGHKKCLNIPIFVDKTWHRSYIIS